LFFTWCRKLQDIEKIPAKYLLGGTGNNAPGKRAETSPVWQAFKKLTDVHPWGTFTHACVIQTTDAEGKVHHCNTLVNSYRKFGKGAYGTTKLHEHLRKHHPTTSAAQEGVARATGAQQTLTNMAGGVMEMDYQMRCKTSVCR
jgi:hypothetical protein